MMGAIRIRLRAAGYALACFIVIGGAALLAAVIIQQTTSWHMTGDHQLLGAIADTAICAWIYDARIKVLLGKSR